MENISDISTIGVMLEIVAIISCDAFSVPVTTSYTFPLRKATASAPVLCCSFASIEVEISKVIHWEDPPPCNSDHKG